VSHSVPNVVPARTFEVLKNTHVKSAVIFQMKPFVFWLFFFILSVSGILTAEFATPINADVENYTETFL
jgi:hypothetical protein